jgi:NAD(P)-dependent dehydrogenase (short-subunit alcohol dehydrogenase family)
VALPNEGHRQVRRLRLQAVCPGWIDTGLNDPIFAAANLDDEGVRVLVEQDVPMNRQGSAEEVAPVWPSSRRTTPRTSPGIRWW